MTSVPKLLDSLAAEGVTDPGATAVVMRLREQNEFLQLRLKYAVSVGAIYRQKIALLLREASSVSGAAGERLEGVVQDVLGEISQLQSPERQITAAAKSASTAAADAAGDAADGSSNRVEFWRDQFLSAMHDARPTSLQDAQAVCRLLQEKNQLAMDGATSAAALASLQQRYAALDAAHTRLLQERAGAADDAVRELYARREAELVKQLEDKNPTSAASIELETENESLVRKNKVLRLRVAQLRQQLQDLLDQRDAEGALTQASTSDLLSQVTTLRAAAAVQEAQSRRLAEELLHARRSVALRDNSLLRAQAKLEALEQQAACALQHGTTCGTENAAEHWRVRMDAVELRLRELEDENGRLRTELLRGVKEIQAREEEVAHVSLQLKVRERSVSAMSQQLRLVEVRCSELLAQREGLDAVRDRLSAAVGAVSGAVQVDRLHDELRGVHSTVEGRVATVQKALDSANARISSLHAENSALAAVIRHCATRGTVPSLVDAEGAALKAANGGSSDAARLVREVVLRQKGQWREVRDISSGVVLYITDDPQGTPFAPDSTLLRAPRAAVAPSAQGCPSPERYSAAEDPPTRTPNPPRDVSTALSLGKPPNDHDGGGTSEESRSRSLTSADPEHPVPPSGVVDDISGTGTDMETPQRAEEEPSPDSLVLGSPASPDSPFRTVIDDASL